MALKVYENSGFVIFELILVMSLVLTVSAIGFISYWHIKGTSLVTDVAMIQLLLHTAATRATCLKKEQTIIIDDARGALLYDDTHYLLQKGFTFGTIPGVYGPPSAPSKPVNSPVTFVDKKIRAYPDGTLQSGTLYITDNQEQYALTTPVSAFSLIRVYRYHKNAWHRY